jgi:spermidine synthase
MMRANPLLFLVIFLEGYAVLSTELLAIRQVMPFLGTGTDTIAIIIAAVLMPLAFGYASGGNFKPHRDKNGHTRTIRNRLLLNLSASSAILGLGLSHATGQIFFTALFRIAGLHNQQTGAVLYALTFIVAPIFMLGQTVPLISNYFHRQHLSAFAGRILFFSTFGSFMGSVFCTLILMPYIGVHNTVIITILCLLVLCLLLSRKAINRYTLLSLLGLLVSWGLNSNAMLNHFKIVRDDQYMTIQVRKTPDNVKRYFIVNGTMASGINMSPGKNDSMIFPNLDYMEKQFITSLPAGHPPIDILVIGAGGFTLGLNDNKNHYTFLDINPGLLDVAETNFLFKKLDVNKKFIPEEARAFLAHNTKKFDLVILDPYQDSSGFPLGLTTLEFFQEIYYVLKDDGIMAGNFVVSANFSDDFSIRLDNTIHSVFPNTNRQALSLYRGWARDKPQITNVIYSAFKKADTVDGIYSDDLNSSFIDKRKVQK